MNPIKTIWIISQFSGAPDLGGVQRHYWLADHWRKKGFHPIIISDPQHHLILKDKRRKKKGYETIDGVDFFWLPAGKHPPQTSILRFLPMFIFAFRLCFIRLNKQLRRPDSLILSSMSIFPVPALFLLKWRFKVKKTIVEVRDLWPLTPILMHGVSPWNPLILYMKLLERWGYQKADAIVSVLANAGEYINPISGDPQKFFYISNGIPDRILDQTSAEIAFKSPTEKIRVTYAGALGIGNGMETFVRFLEQQPQEISDQYVFEFIGEGYLKSEYQRRLARVSNVKFYPKIKRQALYQKLVQTDLCFIAWRDLTLYRYGVAAQKYFDYMAAAKPILAAHAGISDFVDQSQAGIICLNTQKGIEAGLVQFASLDPEERTRLGQRAHAFVQQFRYSVLAEKYLKVIKH